MQRNVWKEKASTWLSRLKTSHAIIVAAIIIPLLIVTGAHYVGHSVWTALTAVGTCGAVLVALFLPPLRTRWRRPILKITAFKCEPPYFRKARRLNELNETVGYGHFVMIRLKNKGKTLARRTQPILTAVGSFSSDEWRKNENWAPVYLPWSLDETIMFATGQPTQERDLVPKRPYFFDLGFWGHEHPNEFALRAFNVPTPQPDKYPPGKHCFEIQIYAENAKPITKYFHVYWHGQYTEDFKEMQQRVIIFATDSSPWRNA